MSEIKKINSFLKKIKTRPTGREIALFKQKRVKMGILQLVVRELIYIVFSTQLFAKSSQITFTFILSIVPFLSILFTFVHYVHGFDNVFTITLAPLIKQHFGPMAGYQISHYLQKIIQSVEVKSLGIISFLTFSVTAILLLFSIEDVFNEIMQVKQKNKTVKRVLKCGLLLTIIPFLFFVVALKSEPIWHLLKASQSNVVQGSFIIGFRLVLALIVQSVFFTFLYYFIPSKKVSLKSLAIGGGVASILFEGLQYLNIYLAHSALSADPHKIYGTVPLIAILFFSWIRFGWLIALVGAAVALACERVIFREQVR